MHLDSIDRATLHKLVLDTLAEHKIKHAGPLLRAVLAELLPSVENAATVPALTIADDEPAAEAVNGAALLDETAAVIKRHVILSGPQADTGVGLRQADCRSMLQRPGAPALHGLEPHAGGAVPVARSISADVDR